MKSQLKPTNPKVSAVVEKFVSKRTKTSKADICELLTDKYPLINELDHMRGKCYCHVCTCGNHICPKDQKHTPISIGSQFCSQYRKSFKKYSNKHFIHYPPLQSKLVNFPLESISISKQDYTAPVLSKTESFSPMQPSYKPLKFTAVSNYSSSFNHFNESFLEKQYVMEHPLNFSGTKFRSNSVYREDFHRHSFSNFKENKIFVSKMQNQARGSRGLISAGSELKLSLDRNKQKKQSRNFLNK